MTLAGILIGATALFLAFPSAFRLIQRKPKTVDWVVLPAAIAVIAWLVGVRP